MDTLSLTVPASWAHLTQKQLRFLLDTIARVQKECHHRPFASAREYSAHIHTHISITCFLQWTGLRVVCPCGADSWLMSISGKEITISTGTLSAALGHLAWIREIPSTPVRLESVDSAKAIPADLSSGFTFDNWLAVETLWQAYQLSSNPALLGSMAGILYHKENISLSEGESLGIFYWWASVKSMLSDMFPHFFRPAGPGNSAPSTDDLRRNMDAQIRALTKGDITKEQEILAIDAMRALTELDALAREYDELNKKYNR